MGGRRLSVNVPKHPTGVELDVLAPSSSKARSNIKQTRSNIKQTLQPHLTNVSESWWTAVRGVQFLNSAELSTAYSVFVYAYVVLFLISGVMSGKFSRYYNVTSNTTVNFLVQVALCSAISLCTLLPFLVGNYSRHVGPWVFSFVTFAVFIGITLNFLKDDIYPLTLLSIVGLLAISAILWVYIKYHRKSNVASSRRFRYSTHVPKLDEIEKIKLENARLYRRMFAIQETIAENNTRITQLKERGVPHKYKRQVRKAWRFLVRFFLALPSLHLQGLPEPLNWRLVAGLFIAVCFSTLNTLVLCYLSHILAHMVETLQGALGDVIALFELITEEDAFLVFSGEPVYVDFSFVITALQPVYNFMGTISRTLVPAMYTGAIMGLMCVFFSAFPPLKSYRRVVGLLKRGQLTRQHRRKIVHADPIKMSYFIGVQFSSSLAGFILVFFTIVFSTLVFASVGGFELIKGQIDYISSFLILLAVKTIMQRIAKRVILDKYLSLKSPRLLFAYDLVMSLVLLITGLYTAIVRFIYAFGYLCICTVRLDLSILPARMQIMDPGYSAFMSMAISQHTVCNPHVLDVVADFTEKRGQKEATLSTNVKRWQKAYWRIRLRKMGME